QMQNQFVEAGVIGGSGPGAAGRVDADRCSGVQPLRQPHPEPGPFAPGIRVGGGNRGDELPVEVLDRLAKSGVVLRTKLPQPIPISITGIGEAAVLERLGKAPFSRRARIFVGSTRLL